MSTDQTTPAGNELRRLDDLSPELAAVADLMAAGVRVAAHGQLSCQCCPSAVVLVPPEVFRRLLDAIEALEPGLLDRVRAGVSVHCD